MDKAKGGYILLQKRETTDVNTTLEELRKTNPKQLLGLDNILGLCWPI